MVANVAGVPEPFTSLNPETEMGIIVDIVVSLYAMVAISCVTGIAASFTHVQKLPENLNLHSLCAALCSIMVGVPLVVLATCCLVGGIMALCEGWTWWTGFLYVSSVSGTNRAQFYVPTATSIFASLRYSAAHYYKLHPKSETEPVF